MLELLLLVLSYLAGSIPFGLWAGRIWGSLDIRQFGSGNIGTSNVARSVGTWPALVVFILDVAKGWAPVALALSLGMEPWVIIAAGVSAVLGHVFSAFLRFEGGKGIATTLGAMIALDPRVAALLLVVWLLVLFVTRYISVASLAGALSLPIFLWVFSHPAVHVAGGTLISLVAAWRHRSNIDRLRTGKEYRLGQRAERVQRR